MKMAKHLGIPTYWEVDDLIFDRQSYEENGNLETISYLERAFYFEEADRHRASLIYAGRGIASTRALAESMVEAGVEKFTLLKCARS